MEGTKQGARRRVRRILGAVIASVALVAGGLSAANADDPPPVITIGGTPVDQIESQLQTLEGQLSTELANLNPEYATVHGYIDTLVNDLGPYLSKAGIPPATLQALILAAQVEAGPTFSATCTYLAYLENNIPTSVLGVPLSVAKLIGLTPTQMQKITAYLNSVINLEVQALQAAVTPSILQLLAMSWNTTAYNSVPSVSRSTAGYVGIPSLIDVDGAPGADLCTDLVVDINTGKITEQIVKMPLTPTTLPVDVLGALPSLGNIALGYSTKTSTAPVSWTSTIGGVTGGSLGITDVSTKPGANLTQVLSLGSAGAITYSWAPVPTTAVTGLGLNSSGGALGLSVPEQVSSASKFGFNIGFPGFNIALNLDKLGVTTAPSTAGLNIILPASGSTSIALDGTFSGGAAVSNSYDFGISAGTLALGVHAAPLPRSFDACGSLAGTACSSLNSVRGLSGTSALNGGVLSYSSRLTSSSATTASVGVNATSCTSAATGYYTQMTGTGENKAFNLGTDLSGFTWEDTSGGSVTDCTNFVGTVLTNLPAGFKAGGTTPGGRLGVWGKTLGLSPQSLVKTGAVTCPSGTSIAAKVGTTTLDLTPYVCVTPPSVTVNIVNIVGTFAAPRVLSFTTVLAVPIVQPLAMPPAAPTTYQWQRCSSLGICSDIAGKTAASYTVVSADRTNTIRVKVTATNAEGTTVAFSANSGVVT